MSQFNKEALQVDDTDENMIVAALMAGLLPSKLLFSLSKNPLSRMADLMVKAQQHLNSEDSLDASESGTPGTSRNLTKEKGNNNKHRGRMEVAEGEKATSTKRSSLGSTSHQVGFKTILLLTHPWSKYLFISGMTRVSNDPRGFVPPREEKLREVLPLSPGPWP